MREIKFRAWDKRFNKMDFGGGDLLLRINKKDFSEPQQFTGLMDKNNNDIYEGDIVEVKNKYGNIVSIREITFGHITDFNEGFNIPIGTGFNINKENCIECEVIGNIYENTTLLNN